MGEGVQQRRVDRPRRAGGARGGGASLTARSCAASCSRPHAQGSKTTKAIWPTSQQAAGGLHYRTVSVSNGQDNAKQVKIVTLVDKRIAPPGAAQEWLFQADLENMLYPSAAVNGTNGAFY